MSKLIQKVTTFSITLVLLSSTFVFICDDSAGGDFLSGPQPGPADPDPKTLTVDDHNATGNIYVPTGKTLIINGGTRLFFPENSDYNITVYGTLLCYG
ncbi:MAG: hypothetical protein JSV49_05945, partial [Thermoplasmata archaeon]